ncbi:MAG: RnfABCDGE type electron transport complex subunit G [Muribaculaceae bacterium]|nr:RnfABCDGE type electron transport complex subunit G [Muribaculaceae bacterium]
MKKLASTLPNMILSLGIITVLSGLLLGVMYTVTKAPIEQSEREMQTAALAEVLPPFDNDPEAEAQSVNVGGQVYEIYPARMDGHSVGVAVKGVTMDGFSGEVVIICGFDNKGTVVNYRVLKQAETPGLGAKMEMWFRDPSGTRSVIGKSPGIQNFSPVKDGGDVDAITAATISSRAFLSVLRGAYEAYRQYAQTQGMYIPAVSDSHTGASTQQPTDCHIGSSVHS